MMGQDLSMYGGLELTQAAPDGGDAWYFGHMASGPDHPWQQAPDIWQAAPHTMGRWDGKTNISHWDATKLVKGYWPQGEMLPAQRQPRGTCVARGGSGGLNVLQCVLIALGNPFEFKPISHSALYGDVRELGGIRGNQDGAMGADAAKALAQWGAVTQREAGEAEGKEGYYSDDKAVLWGSGRGGVWTPPEIRKQGADNLVKEVVQCRSAQQAADIIASGGVVTVASNQGFTMSRDQNGCCRASGSWAHQMYFAAVVVVEGRNYLGCAQSWGENVPDGPLLWPGHCPSYVFGVEFGVADRMLGQGDSMGFSAFQGWPTLLLPWADRFI